MSRFDGANTEAWVAYLGATRDELDALLALVASYREHFAGTGVPLTIVDQSRATREEMWKLGSREGNIWLPIHERQKGEFEEPDVSLEEIQDALAQVASDGMVRVHQTDERFFHSQCINRILNEWSEARFVLLFDSDSLIQRNALLTDVAKAFPVDEWDSITAVGSLVDFVDSTRREGTRRRLGRLLGLGKAAGRDRARRWRLPRLHPYALLIHRALVQARAMDFRLLFLDVLEAGWTEDELRAGRMLGDTGSSLLMQSAYHGLRVGDFPMGKYVTHQGRTSHRPKTGRKLGGDGWW